MPYSHRDERLGSAKTSAIISDHLTAIFCSLTTSRLTTLCTHEVRRDKELVVRRDKELELQDYMVSAFPEPAWWSHGPHGVVG